MAIKSICPSCTLINMHADDQANTVVPCLYCGEHYGLRAAPSGPTQAGPVRTAPPPTPRTAPRVATPEAVNPAPAGAIQERARPSGRSAPPPVPSSDVTPARLAEGRRRDRDDDLEPRPRRERSVGRPDRAPESNVGLILGLSLGGGFLLICVIIVVVVMATHRAEEAQVVVMAEQAAAIQAPAAPQPQPGANPANKAVLDPARPEDFEAMLANLKSPVEEDRRRAYEWLRKANAGHPRRAEVAKIMEGRVPEHRAKVFGDDVFFEAYFAWATKDNYDWLSKMARNEDFTVWGNQRRHQSMYTLGKLKDARAVDDLVPNLESVHHREPALKALISLGGVAEPKLIPLLTHANRDVRYSVARVLVVTGTRASLNALDLAAAQFAQDRQFVQEVQQARELIVERGK